MTANKWPYASVAAGSRLGPSLRRSVRARPVFRSKRKTVKDGVFSKRDGDGRELWKKTEKVTPHPRELRNDFFRNLY